jgi:hypothetical protein
MILTILSESINGIVVVTAIILIVGSQTVSVERRKRALFSLVDYNNLERISTDELVRHQIVSSAINLHRKYYFIVSGSLWHVS